MLKVQFKRLLYAQVGYLVIAIMYNMASYYQWQSTGQSFIVGSNPIKNSLTLCLLLVPLLLGFTQRLRWYAVITMVLMIPLFYAGIWHHIAAFISQDMSRYYSASIWLGAVLINVFGVSVGVFASLTAYRLQCK